MAEYQAMNTGTEDGNGGTDEVSDMILSKNNLYYKMPQSLSTTIDRTFSRQYAQRSSYSAGDTIVFDLNTGTSYLDPNNAVLSMDVNLAYTGTATAGAPPTGTLVSFGSGLGAVSLIQEIRLMSKNGTPVDRIESANVLAKIMSEWTFSDETNKYAQMALKDHAFTTVAGFSQRAVIPLKWISGFFRPTVRDMFIPSGLASGMRIEITLARANRAFYISSAGGISNLTYTITDPTILCMLHSLNDPTAAALMENSAQTGLEYTFPSYFASTVTTTQSAINEQVKKAVSQCTRVFTTAFVVSGAESSLLETKDGFKSIDAGTQFGSYQYRVGSSYYPQNVIDDVTEAWYVTNAAFDKNRDALDANGLQYSTYVTNGKFTVGVPLQTHDRLNLSGLPINNSSVLELRLTLVPSAESREITTFMEYITVARTFVNKTSVKI